MLSKYKKLIGKWLSLIGNMLTIRVTEKNKLI